MQASPPTARGIHKFVFLIFISMPAISIAGTHVILQTPFGDVKIELFDEATPATVANFLKYVDDGDYQNSFIHRSVPGFVVQGGGFTFIDTVVGTVPADPPVVNEPGISNLRGTIAMAKQSGDPNSATNQWYINLDDNSADLDDQNGGFTVFGQVVGNGMDIIDTIAALTPWNAGAPFDWLPLIDYSGSGDITVDHLVMVDIVRDESYEINAGQAGAWLNPLTPGQGLLIDVEPEDHFMFLAWFAFTGGTSEQAAEQHWFTAQGNYSGNQAELVVYETLGGKFDEPQEVATDPVGTVTLSFSDCGHGQMAYTLDHWGVQDDFPLERVIPESDGICQQQETAVTTQAVKQSIDINAGMDGAWFDPETPGQGFLFDAQPDPEGGNFIFVAWFTFGDDTAAGQRWLTAQGGFEGSTAALEVSETTGGRFDDPQAVDTEPVGTLNIDFNDCSNASVTYSLPAEMREGAMEITRALPRANAVCESLELQEN